MEIEIYSKQLAKQIQLANLLLGNFTSYCKRGNRDGNIVHIMAKGTNSLSPDNIPFIIGPFLQDLRKAKNISLKIMSYKTGIDSSHILRIEKGKMKTIQKNTISKISRVLGNPIKIDNLLKADLCWLKVIDIKKLKEEEKVYDLEVKPNNKNIENFLDINGIILHNSGYMSDPKTQKFLEENHSKFDGIFRKTWTPYKNHINKQKGLNEF